MSCTTSSSTTSNNDMEQKWSTARTNQAQTGRFDRLNRFVALADAAGPSHEHAPASVPVIDISSFVEDDIVDNDPVQRHERQAQCVQEILSACRDTGFFQITGHGVPQKVVDRMTQETRAFFAQPRHVKEQASDPVNAAHGYYAEENINATLGREGSADVREGYAIGPSDDENCAFFQNLWPPQELCGDGFETAAKEYYACMERLESVLAVLFTRALKLYVGGDAAQHLTDDWVQTSTGRHRGLLRPNSFPRDHTGTFGAHTDWSTFTILKTTAPGLEVVQNGEWRQVPFDQNDRFVINVGDMLEQWSNGAFRSSIHRVNCAAAAAAAAATSSNNHNRISLAYFCAEVVDPTDHTVVRPIVKSGESRVFDEDLSMLEYMKRNFEGMTGKDYGGVAEDDIEDDNQ